jgi:micrococcal nuclease
MHDVSADRRTISTVPKGSSAIRRRWVAIALWVVLLALVSTPGLAKRAPVEIVRVVDGDTVIVRRAGREVKVRLLGVDTPERGWNGKPGEPFSRVATRFTRNTLARAERVELEVDGDRVDEHGRVLGFLWVWLRDRPAPTNLSEELLQAGLARAIRFFEYPKKQRFLELERVAARRGRGMWQARFR